nr:D-alanine--D-alanine ligase family protein [uncultured Anaerotignum sp.]
MKKLTVVVLFGGQSSEYEVSCVSAANVIVALDEEKYDVLPVGITKDGNWRICHGSVDAIREGRWEKYSVDAILSPDASRKSLLKLVGGKYKEIPVDVVIPVLCGAGGAVQGLLEMAQIPYVGGGVLSSALSMNRIHTKGIAKAEKIPMAKFFWCDREVLAEKKEKIMNQAEKKLGYPCFVKPANASASVGASKAKNREELEKALCYAAKYDRKVIMEEAIDGRRFACAMLKKGKMHISSIREVVTRAEFCNHDAKFHEGDAHVIIPGEVPEEALVQMRKISEKMYHAVDASGLARVDFFMEKNGRVLFDELNTMPDSMYPMFWEEEGMSKTELMDILISLALEEDIHG